MYHTTCVALYNGFVVGELYESILISRTVEKIITTRSLLVRPYCVTLALKGGCVRKKLDVFTTRDCEKIATYLKEKGVTVISLNRNVGSIEVDATEDELATLKNQLEIEGGLDISDVEDV